MKKNNRGFTFLEVLVVVIIVGLLGAVGWLVYDRQKTKTTDSQTNTQATSQKQETAKVETTTTSSGTQTYVSITQWGVKLPVDSSVSGLSYSITGKYASIRSAELDKLSGTCISNSVHVARGTANEIVPNEMGDTEGSTFLEAYSGTTVDNSNLNARAIKAKSGDYYFVVPGFAGASCVDIPYTQAEGKAKQEAETAAVLNIVKAINKLVQQ